MLPFYYLKLLLVVHKWEGEIKQEVLRFLLKLYNSSFLKYVLVVFLKIIPILIPLQCK